MRRPPPHPLPAPAVPPVTGDSIGALLRGLRRNRKLTQTALAEAAGLSLSGIGHIEYGRSALNVTTLWRLSIVLGLTDAEIVRIVRAAANWNEPPGGDDRE